MAAKWTDFVAGAVLTAAQLNDVLDNFQDVAIFNETQSSGTNGGTSTSGSFIKRTFNTTVVNNITGCSIASSVITLPAGSYVVTATSPYFGPPGNTYVKTKLRNTSDSTDTLISQNGFIAPDSQGISLIQGFFTIAASKNFELQYRVSNGLANNGLGINTSMGVSEIYAIIQIAKVA